MILLTAENKYGFDMQVSARAMGSRDRRSRTLDTGSAPSAFA
jgi:hypothetical protein